MHSLIGDICENSTPDKGICLGNDKYDLLCRIKKYNYDYIYKNKQLDDYKQYVDLVLKSIFKKLFQAYQREYTIQFIRNEYASIYPKLSRDFVGYLCKYCTHSMIRKCDKSLLGMVDNLENEKIYGGLSDSDSYVQAIIDYISGMTDSYAVSLFNELITFS